MGGLWARRNVGSATRHATSLQTPAPSITHRHGRPAHGWQKWSPCPVGTALRAIPHPGVTRCATFAAWRRGCPRPATFHQSQ